MNRMLALVLSTTLIVLLVAFYIFARSERNSDAIQIEHDFSRSTTTPSASPTKSGAPVPSEPRVVSWVFDNKVLANRKLVAIPVPSRFASPSVKLPQGQAVAGDKVYRFEAVNGGFFPKVDVAIKSVLPISIYYPDGKSGETIVVQSIDGGTLDNKSVVQTVTLDEGQQASFNLHLTSNPGIFRVMLRTSGDMKMLNFWAGSPMTASN